MATTVTTPGTKPVLRDLVYSGDTAAILTLAFTTAGLPSSPVQPLAVRLGAAVPLADLQADLLRLRDHASALRHLERRLNHPLLRRRLDPVDLGCLLHIVRTAQQTTATMHRAAARLIEFRSCWPDPDAAVEPAHPIGGRR